MGRTINIVEVSQCSADDINLRIENADDLWSDENVVPNSHYRAFINF